jgi:DNA-directed RNA polymerase specialized sigma24 family protein
VASGDPQFGSFPATRWSLVSRARDASLADKQRALSELLERYRPAFVRHLVRRRRLPIERAEDLVQGFMTVKVLEKNLIAQASRERGRFRSFMLKSLERYVIDEYRRRDLPTTDVDEFRDTQPDAGGADAFDIAWAQQALAETYVNMLQACEASDKMHVWHVFEHRVLRPTMDGGDVPSYEQLAERYGFTSPTEAGNLFVTARRMFERELRAVIEAYAGEADVDREIGDLIDILSRQGSAV